MSAFTKQEIGDKANELKRGLYSSYLSLTVVGLTLLLVGLAANIWLSNHSLHIINVSTPKVELIEEVNTWLESSRADLNSWIAEENPLFKQKRKLAWQSHIYPTLTTLKSLAVDDSESIIKLNALEKQLRQVELWQWHIEDVAQTLGNIPSLQLLTDHIQPLERQLLQASSALIEIELTNQQLNIHHIKIISQFRSDLFYSVNHLNHYISHGSKYSKHEFHNAIKLAELKLIQFSKMNKMLLSNQLEQLIILSDNFKAYKKLSTTALTLRDAEDWNIAKDWSRKKLLPKTDIAHKTLSLLLKTEKINQLNDAQTITLLSTYVPIVMLALLLLMIMSAIVLAKKGIKKFVGPVVELEIQDQLKSDVDALNNKLIGINNIKLLSQEVIQYIAQHTNAVAGSLFVEQDNLLRMQGAYAISSNHLHSHSGIEIGEGLVGQVYVNNKTQIVHPDDNDDFIIQSSLLEISPKTLLITPIQYQGNAIAIIELAVLKELSEYDKTFIQKSLKNVGSMIIAVQQAEAIHAALAESQAQSEELSAQQEELSASNESLENQKEELRATNEELNVQSESIKEKSDSLETQAIELKLAEKVAQEKAKQLEESSRYKSEFLANMSHELRTPLNSLLILAKMLAENSEQNLNEDQIESAEVIHDSGSHLLNLINDILDLSKIEAGRMEVACETIELKDIALSMNTRFKHMAANKGIEFKVSGVENCANSIQSDGLKIAQVLTNLIGNAIKFTKNGSVTLEFAHSDQDSGHIHFSIIDTGIGIEPEQQTAIFEAFQQEDGSTSRNFGGTGLGLSISMAYAKLMGGSIKVSSVKNEGSIFTLVLPVQSVGGQKIENAAPVEIVKPVINESYDITPPPYKDDRDDLDSSKSLLMIVEDDPKFSKILFKEAHANNYQCIVAPDAESGLGLLLTYDVKGILLDLSLPTMDGKQFLTTIKAQEKYHHIPVHVISALDNSGEELRKGAVGYLTKPVNKEQINEALNRIQHFTGDDVRRILLVDDDQATTLAITKLFKGQSIEFTQVHTCQSALEKITQQQFDTLILDLGLPDENGIDWLEKINNDPAINLPPVIIYSGQVLSEEDENRIRAHTDSIVIKSSRSAERLLDEVSLFLHHVNKTKDDKPDVQAKKSSVFVDTSSTPSNIEQLSEKRVLVVDDNMRNTFALSKALRSKGMVVEMASSGQLALTKLAELDSFDLVLMDIMMPEMDGYQTTQHIREQAKFKNLPIIAVTAKAMKGDKEKCLAAGANDYLSKPIDMDKLQTLMLAWINS